LPRQSGEIGVPVADREIAVVHYHFSRNGLRSDLTG